MPQPVAARWTRANPARGVSLDAKPSGDYRRFSLPPPFRVNPCLQERAPKHPKPHHGGPPPLVRAARPTTFRAGDRQVDSRSSRRGRTTPNDRSKSRVPRLEPATIGATRPLTLGHRFGDPRARTQAGWKGRSFSGRSARPGGVTPERARPTFGIAVEPAIADADYRRHGPGCSETQRASQQSGRSRDAQRASSSAINSFGATTR
jgi:hypothetical protein